MECGEYFADKIKYDGCPIEKKNTANYWSSCCTCPLKDCGVGWREYRIKRTFELMGHSIEEIAEELRVSVATIRKYQRASV